jgi:uncharacterized cofD-like protein
MKPSLLRLLVCPSCRSGLDLQVASWEGTEVGEGQLRCRGCGREYTVTRGVPRFVPDDAYAASFGREWRFFRTVQLDSANRTRQSEETFRATTGWSAADIEGRLVLDAGVGSGRFAEVAAAAGGEVVGVDLSGAVDAAYENVGRGPHVHIVQADIFALPFRESEFDLAYSIGVLHHTPDPRRAFDCVARKVRPGGSFAVYLYAGYGPGFRGSDALRRLTTRLPHGVMLALATLAGPLHYLYRVPLLGRLLQLACPIARHPDWRWRWLDTFDWYTPRYQWKLLYPDVHRWFREAGFGELEIFEEPIRMRGTRAGEVELIPADASPGRGLRVAAVGGGTGLPVVLQGLKHALLPRHWRRVPAAERTRLSGIVTVADDGGSSGRLRHAHRVLAPGDVRNCLVALADGDAWLAELFQYRFPRGRELGGHSLGNLILTALAQADGGFHGAVQRAAELLAARGQVLPSTLDDARLVADLSDGTCVIGESCIAGSRVPIRRLRFDPPEPTALPQACEALRDADLVVLGPGSLYTSLLPNLLVRGVAQALRESRARTVLVMNLMTERGETAGYSAADHVEALRRHVPGLALHDVLLNSAPIEPRSAERYLASGEVPVGGDVAALEALGCRVWERDLLAPGEVIRHDPHKLASALLDLAHGLAAPPLPASEPLRLESIGA